MIVLILAMAPVTLLAQYKVQINIVSVPAGTQADKIYMAGNFNSWNPKDSLAAFIKNSEGKFAIRFNNVENRQYEFKFTLGSWETVETTADGKDVGNRLVKIESDTTLNFTVGGWKKASAPAARKHTASANVHIIDTAFYIPQLQRYRRLWVYLPPGYAASQKRYPVLYMHDGQNLFDEYTAPFGEWGVDEALDTLSPKSKTVLW